MEKSIEEERLDETLDIILNTEEEKTALKPHKHHDHGHHSHRDHSHSLHSKHDHSHHNHSHKHAHDNKNKSLNHDHDHHDHYDSKNENMHGVYLHVLADTIGSVGNIYCLLLYLFRGNYILLPDKIL